MSTSYHHSRSNTMELPSLHSQPSVMSVLSYTSEATTSTTHHIQNAPAPLVRHTQHLLQPNGSINGVAVASAILPLFPDLLSAMPSSDRPALRSSDDSCISCLSHTEIRNVLHDVSEQLHNDWKLGRGHRLALVLPNGPELALAILAVSCVGCVVPLNAFGASQELANDLRQAQVDAVLGLASSSSSESMEAMCRELDIPFVGLTPIQGGRFKLAQPTTTRRYEPPRHYLEPAELGDEADRCAGDFSPRATATTSTSNTNWSLPNQHRDAVLLLFTSGTTGSKKLVPHLLQDVLVATACIAISWKLTPADTNCNLMPLFHVGGIVRQVYSPLLSGGCVICCPSFDPNTFWNLSGQFTWYYAAPTMHQLILQTGRAEGFIDNNGKCRTLQLRMIANAAGGLLPSVARELRQAFGAHVLPSYGMTECMPITSPPASYQLEKPGTSGVAVGPEIAILDRATGRSLQTGKEGPICVRGAPCFRGYGRLANEDDSVSANSFLPGGWFDTGDLGYMDADGYLYITGRSKEVINRGGEIISPMEVEEACVSHPSVTACVAFSTQHSVLQECVGLLLVPAKNTPRIDLPALHEYLGQGRLAAAKWPQCLVYMDAVPKSFTNKLLRVKLGKRLGLPEVNDNMYTIERTFQAKCPPIGAPVSLAIPCERVSVSAAQVQQILLQHVFPRLSSLDLLVVPHPNKIGSLVCYVSSRVNRLSVIQTARDKLHAYAVPSHVCVCLSPQPLDHLEIYEQLDLCQMQPPQPSDAVASIVQEEKNRDQGPLDPLVLSLQELFQNLLDLDCLPQQDSNFFNLGGSSMLASQLASKIRKLHNVPFGGAEVFHASSCSTIAGVIRERRGDPPHTGDNASASKLSLDPASMAASSLFSQKLDLSQTPFQATRLDTHFGYMGLLFQLIPLLIIYPFWQISRFFLFFRSLLWILHHIPVEGNLYKFVMTLVVFHALWVTITPLLFVVCKWLIIGKYRSGRFPLWGEYYLRWWLVDILRKLIGRGSWGAHPVTLNLYYRMLGAQIGKNARISSNADIAEFDLVSIGEGAAVEFATVRGFGVDNGSMILGPVGVGRFSSVGGRSVVAPYTSIQDGAHLGPATSSYEISASFGQSNAQAVDHLRYNRQAFPKPSLSSQLFVISPITFLVDALSHIPALLVLAWMVAMPQYNDSRAFNSISDLVSWLANPYRIPFFIGIRIVRAILAPFFYMTGAILVKWFIIGKFQPGPRDVSSEWELIRHELAETLFSRENMQSVTDIIGRHYEAVSVFYRMLGAKIGKRVFWPGRQPVFTGEFDLLEIGDDVVFGSRTSLICTTVDSCEKITLCAGSNVSDNTVVLPGSVIGKGAVLGSNSVCPAGRYLPEASVWFGSRSGEPVMLEKGIEENVSGPIQASEVDFSRLQMEGDESTQRPFGRAFYYREADYFVYPLPLIVAFTVLIRVLIAALSTLPILAALHLSAGYFYGWPIAYRKYNLYDVTSSEFYTVLLVLFTLTHFLHVNIWLMLEVASKWILMGRRTEGRFNYDTSSYGQNWELYQICSRVREVGRMNFLDFITGTPYMSTFFRLLGCKVGNDCCLYPTGADPFMPEPDLVEMGDRCVIDCASVVCHLNTRGNFELAKIVLKNNVTLRARSRIQQGVQMESGSMLLEKSLAMTGEIIEADSVWLGAPAARLFSYDTSSIGTRSSASYGGSNHEQQDLVVGAFV